MKEHFCPAEQSIISYQDQCNWCGEQEPDDIASILACRDMLDAQPVPPRTWVDLTDEQLRTEFGKLYPNDIGILELAENNRDFAVEAIGARHHWVAFQAGARAAEAKLKELNT